MIVQRPPMGWNTWNTFGCNISDKLIREMADCMEKEGYLEAGYEYVSIDDGWMLRERDMNGRLVPDPAKFPDGIKSLADYLHKKGFKLGIYSCAGVLTCGGYPGSFGHEYKDAEQFAEWGVDLLKYDYCNFPEFADGRNAYLTMSMALRSCGRDILLSACNWGYHNPENWMREVGAHMYRSDTDIKDFYVSFRDIAMNHIKNMKNNTKGCFVDIDMLTVGMFGNGHVGSEDSGSKDDDITMREYEMQFAYWCLNGAPLILGADIRKIPESCAKLLKNRELIRLACDEDCRPPALVYGYDYHIKDDGRYIMIRLLENNDVAIGFFNFEDSPADLRCLFASCGIPFGSGFGIELTDIISGERIGLCSDYVRTLVPSHGCRIFRGKLIKCENTDFTVCKTI